MWKSGLSQMLLELCNNCIKKEASSNRAHQEPPWLIQNANGNTPLHDALLAKNNKLVMTLLTFGPSATNLVNKRIETPLHLFAGWPISMEFEREELHSMVKAHLPATLDVDKDGLTPLMRAAQAGNIFTAMTLCTLSPKAAYIGDPNGRTIWHFVLDQPSDYLAFLLLRNAELRDALKLADKNGDTPLHLAIKSKRFDLLKVFLQTLEYEHEPAKGSGEPSTTKGKDEWLFDLFKIQNIDGTSPGDLIGESTILPPDIEKCIGARKEMIGIRSVWGIPTIQMKTYVNTMGIIAALLTTITFTAAFAVPGGLFENRGIPVLITRAAFQVFMVSDVVAMCLSMMVLVCLLWIMATSNRSNSVMILDLSIAFLLGSIYATVIAFMTGLYAAIFPVAPWIAIFTLVLCISVLLVVIRRFVVFKWLIPLGRVVFGFSRRVQQSAKVSI